MAGEHEILIQSKSEASSEAIYSTSEEAEFSNFIKTEMMFLEKA